VGVNKCAERTLAVLKNAVHDADAVAKALKQKAGFRLVGDGTFGSVDPTFHDLLRLLQKFNQEIEDAKGRGCLAVFYYSGHGLLADGPVPWNAQQAVEQHYLLPTDYDDSDGSGLRRTGIILESDVLNVMKGAAVSVVLVDACRSLSEREPMRGPGSVREVIEGWGKISTGNVDRAMVLAYACSKYAQAGDGLDGQSRFTLELLEVCINPTRWCCHGRQLSLTPACCETA
jgi:Caspase domain